MWSLYRNLIENLTCRHVDDGKHDFDISSTRICDVSVMMHFRNLFSQIRGVEIGIVVLVLMVWAGAIGLFFNRWGKIRMLLPYQPDYKQDQLKVPGTAPCPPGQCNGHQHQVKFSFFLSQKKVSCWLFFSFWPSWVKSQIESLTMINFYFNW